MTPLEALKVWIGEHFYGEVEETTLWGDAACGMVALEMSGFTIVEKKTGPEPEGQFLLDRLDEFERDGLSGYGEREWIGHVAPAIARFRAALAKAEGSLPHKATDGEGTKP